MFYLMNLAEKLLAQLTFKLQNFNLMFLSYLP